MAGSLAGRGADATATAAKKCKKKKKKKKKCRKVVAPIPVPAPAPAPTPTPPGNAAPTAVGDNATIAEDAAATAIDVLANDTDPEGDPKTIVSKTDGSAGTVAITGGGSGLTFTPNANYCNSPPGTTPATFTYTLNGGSTAIVAVTVTCVNDGGPIAVDDVRTVSSDTTNNPITGLTGNDTDPDLAFGDVLTIINVTNDSNGTASLVAGTPYFTPTPSTFGTGGGFDYTVQDSGGLTDIGQVAITIVPQCSDGLDIDGDGAADHPADTGCNQANDTNERELGFPCDDGMDNDGDGKIDFVVDTGNPGYANRDPQCTSPLDGDESA